ncbi:MAG: L-threonylcarbamoyladenylate synthase [Desulfurivibrionaceae bacterium]|nr:L-threonylcarbamoyladenylate synthase [Desulfobulbales bacterium]MDT8334217.1 L-threonylcarbamoyladenylate synthase [Desulfurivibrionaceae bacterium]
MSSLPVLSINPDNPQPRLISQAARHLQQGGVICYPTDTVYGIGCDIFNLKAVKRIYRIKRRATSKPFSFMCADLKDISKYCLVSNTAYRLMKKNLPGAYTFILPTLKIVPKIMISKQKTVGIRVPDNAICRALIEELGNPILTTSAVVGDDTEPMAEPFQIEERLGNQLDALIDAGPVYPAPSTVVSLVNDEVEIIRYGKGDTSLFE